MNYNKKNATKKRKRVMSKKAQLSHRFALILGRTALVAVFIAIIIGCCAAFGIYKGILASAPDIRTLDVSPSGYLSTVYDCNGEEIDTLVSAGSNRQYVGIKDIPKKLQLAFVAIEDTRFYEHKGIDLKGIVRAGVTFITSGFKSQQGASTITQQLLKNNVFTGWVEEKSTMQKVKRKIQEQYLAVQLEKIVDKDWILENYLNTINLGQNTLGVQAASLRYFNKDVSELTLSECAVIAGITQNPSRYNPIRHPENNKKRMEKVLRDMLSAGFITEKEYQEALTDDVYARIQQFDETYTTSNSSYFVDELVEQVVADLMTYKGYSEAQAYKLVYSGGLKIYSTEDPEIQRIMEEALTNPDNYPGEKTYINWHIRYTDAEGKVKALSEQTILAYYKERKSKNYTLDYSDKEAADEAIATFKEDYVAEFGGEFDDSSESVLYIPEPQASMSIIDHTTGEVKAIVGGRGEKTGRMTLNRATNTYRQPGSTFKVLAAYAPALDSLGKTLASVQDDAPHKKTDGTDLKNYDKKFRGFTTFREGIYRSINIVAVKTLEEVSPQVGYDYLLNFGFTSLSTQDIVQVLCLGGITKGVSNIELCAAYASIANHGTYIKPRFYTKILDNNGNILIDNTTTQEHRVLKETTAWLLTSAMRDTMTIGTSPRANFSGMSIAGKSGTTSNNRDALFAGFTPYYTCVSWGGYDDNSVMKDTGYVKDLWRIVMSQIHKELPDTGFPMPEGIVKVAICTKSGLLPIEGVCDCDPRGSCVREEYFEIGTVPTEYCNHHIGLKICTMSGCVASANCPDYMCIQKVFIIGGDPLSEDGPYLAPEGFEDQVCPIHKDGYDPDPPDDPDGT
ncbi:MAG: penicillin-binding protein [Lachnospiraceae bacterium]|nr:penicillin-binding protein [Lachnospiraceae bacterium]MBR5788533.1 penicillin-binding protein [Lachnospiraceae bacterium]